MNSVLSASENNANMNPFNPAKSFDITHKVYIPIKEDIFSSADQLSLWNGSRGVHPSIHPSVNVGWTFCNRKT
jgi:hypothetical protein